MLYDLIRTIRVNKLISERKQVRDMIKKLDESQESMDPNAFSELFKKLTSLNGKLENIRYEDRG